MAVAQEPADRHKDDAPAPARHVARHFELPPDRQRARDLLEDLNGAACRFGPRSPRAPLVIYGAGNLGRLAYEHLRITGCDVRLVVDRQADELQVDPFWAGVRIADPAKIEQDLRATALLAVSVATVPFVPLEAALIEAGWHDVVPFYDIAESLRERHPLSNGWFAGHLGTRDVCRTAEVLDAWHDDVSRAHHLQFIAWRRLREEWAFGGAPITLQDRFFIAEVMERLDATGVFVDAGAHHGSVTEKIVAMTGGSFASIVAIEPDAESRVAFARLQAGLDPQVASRISVLPVALDATERQRAFHGGLGYASQLSATGEAVLQTRSLDALDLAPDFIKLHLEGGELDALRGGIETLRRHRPIVAVTTYHNADGIWRTPAFLMERLENYRFLMRLHSWCGTGAVVYAIPEEAGR